MQRKTKIMKKKTNKNEMFDRKIIDLLNNSPP